MTAFHIAEISETEVEKVLAVEGGHFADPEAANAHIQVLDESFPLGDGYSYTFLREAAKPGLVLKIEVGKSREIRAASNGTVYLRKGAQNLPVSSEEELARLRRDKGSSSLAGCGKMASSHDETRTDHLISLRDPST